MGSFFSVLVICHILPHISAHVYHFLLEDVLMEGGNPLWIYGHQGPPLVSNDIHWICLAGQNPCFFPMDIYHHIPLNEFKWYKVRSHKNSHIPMKFNFILFTSIYTHIFSSWFLPQKWAPADHPVQDGLSFSPVEASEGRAKPQVSWGSNGISTLW